jgi:geranylgeranyl transferase type-2 subunit beta
VRAASSTDYLAGLAQRLAFGVQRLPAGFRSVEAHYVAAAQRADGGFAGRRGGSDLYYTSFGLRSAAVLGVMDTRFWGRAGRYLAALPPPRDVVECFCRLYSRRLMEERGGCACAQRDEDLVGVLERCRPAGGGPGVYQAFLAALCWQMLGRGFPGAGGVVDAARQAAVGGGTNPAAAALGLLGILGALDAATAERAARSLASMQRPEGGFAANAGAPAADLLSTFTALVALDDLGALDQVKLAPAARLTRGLHAPDGGFLACAGDDAPDVEYTYYGLGTLGLLALVAARNERNP